MKKLLHILLVIIALLMDSSVAAQTHLEKPITEYTPTPLGIDVSEPLFRWQMVALDNKRGFNRGVYELAYDFTSLRYYKSSNSFMYNIQL